MNFVKLAGATLGAALFSATAFAAGDLAVKGTDLPELVVGQGEAGFGVSQKTYELETGKLYQLVIKATGAKECAWQSPGLFQNIFLRKVEAGGMEIKAVHLLELEFEDEGEAEIFFVPVRTGTFKWYCKGMEARGMEGEFVIK